MSLIPEETLQQILDATDIVDLVGRHVKLRRAGTNFVGLCPFHQEKSPSFNVSPHRRSYHCFGCGAGGNAFRFMMEHAGLSFVDAVKRLAEQAGIHIQEEQYDANAEREAKVRKALIKVHAEAAEWFHTLLMRHKVAADARAYLKSRGISQQAAKDWQMGYAPPYGDLLREWALEKKFSENLLVTAGILARPEEDSGRGNQTYPRFRHRLMFPIRNDFGECIAFSGRLLDPEAKAAKYLNSPETPIFSKSKVLFGLDKSKRAIGKADRAIVCEGQIDMITAFVSGVENIVAPLGTAFTEFHARKLKQLAAEVVLCFDSDNAGYKAAERAFAILAPVGLTVKVAPLPQGEDPDSLIRGQGVDAFRSCLEQARDFFEHMMEYASTHRNLGEVRERTRVAEEMAGMVRLLDNTIARDAAIQTVARRLGIPEEDLRKLVVRAQKAAPATAAKNGATPSPAPVLPPQDDNAAMLARCALGDESILTWLRKDGDGAILQHLSGCELLALVWKGTLTGTDPASLSAFLATLSREEESSIIRLLARPLPENAREIAEAALLRLVVAHLNNLLQMVRTQLKQHGLSGDEQTRLQERELALRKEYLDRRGQLQKFSGPSAP